MRTDTTVPLAKAIGLDAWLGTSGQLVCPVTIVDAKVAYGSIRFLVEGPTFSRIATSAMGEEPATEPMRVWVDASRLRVATPNGLVAGSTFGQGGA